MNTDAVTIFRNALAYTKSMHLVIGLLSSSFTSSLFADDNKTTSKSITQIVISCEQDLKQDHDDYYYSHLLKLALTKTIPTHGDYELKYIPVMPITNRLLRDVERGSIDVTWMPYAKNLKYDLIPVKIRLLKNLSDYRIFLVRNEDAEKFSAVKNLGDLRKFKGGMGSHWPDRYVMEENGLPLVLSLSYFNLFKMLKSNRFDYFARGIYQVKAELEHYAHEGITLEKHLFLRYENPFYFYLHKENTQLAERIETGLKLAIDDGSFNELFNRIDNLRWGEKLLAEHNRTVIQLHTYDK